MRRLERCRSSRPCSLVGLFAPATFAAAPAARRRCPRSSSSSGRPAPPRMATGRRPASPQSIARHYTPDVTELYSPNATWPAVKDALKGASLVVYMGHGNGWPSRYRDDLLPAHPERLRPQPDAGRRRLHPPVLRRGVGRLRGQARQERGRPAQPPVLRQRQHRARPAGGHARRGQPAGRQLRGRLHPGGRLRRHRRGLVEPLLLRHARSSAAPGRSRTPGCAARARTGTGSGSPASAARATSPRWTRRRAPPGSPARSS